MEKSTFILVYVLTLVFCIAVSVLLILILNDGIKKYFRHISHDKDIAKFFTKLMYIIILLGGISAAIPGNFDTGEKANWLTVTWDAAKQIESSLSRVFITLLVLAITFLILHLVARRINK